MSKTWWEWNSTEKAKHNWKVDNRAYNTLYHKCKRIGINMTMGFWKSDYCDVSIYNLADQWGFPSEWQLKRLKKQVALYNKSINKNTADKTA